MTNLKHPLPPGFGTRLKEERKRRGLTQAALADLAGIGRLAQNQYEQESRSPNVRYLSAIFSAGLDISFILLGTKNDIGALSAQDLQDIETKALSLVATTEREIGPFPDDKRFVMYQLMRSRLIDKRLSEIEISDKKAINE